MPVKSFVACVEVKNHSPDSIRYHGTHFEVLYDGQWHDATAQAQKQAYALKNLQRYPYRGTARRNKTFVQSVLWLRRVPNGALSGVTSSEWTRVLFEDLTWQQLVDGFMKNKRQGKVQTLMPKYNGGNYHSYESLVERLTAKVKPTQLDLKRVNELTQKRFDADKQGYVRNLGAGILMFKGRAGTGKTFALIQMAIYLARQGKRAGTCVQSHS